MHIYSNNKGVLATYLWQNNSISYIWFYKLGYFSLSIAPWKFNGHTYIHTCIHTYVHTCIHIYIHTVYADTHSYTQTYTHSYICTTYMLFLGFLVHLEIDQLYSFHACTLIQKISCWQKYLVVCCNCRWSFGVWASIRRLMMVIHVLLL